MSIIMFIAGYGGSLLGGMFASLYVAWRAAGARLFPLQRSTLPDFYKALSGDARAASRVQAFGVVLGLAAAIVQYRLDLDLDVYSTGTLVGVACLTAFVISLVTNPPPRSAKRQQKNIQKRGAESTRAKPRQSKPR
jgi:hypothetical protein